MSHTDIMLYEGRRLAIKLVKHIRACRAAGAVIPCSVDGVTYAVKIEEVSPTQAEKILAEEARQAGEAHGQFGVGA